MSAQENAFPDSLYERFRASAAAHPDRVAIEVGGREHTYASLEAMAEEAAERIVSVVTVVPPRIGLVAYRDVATYAGYLAILRLRRSVVPLPADSPRARLQRMISDAGLDLVLDAGDDTDAARGVRTLHVDTAGAAARKGEAYLLFTSGSTGRPKGVPITQENVLALLDGSRDAFGLRPGARASQCFDLTFDLSVYDLFATWSAGATVVVPDKSDLLRPERFVARKALTHWFSVPSVVTTARAAGGLRPGSMPSLEHSLFCGEPLTEAQARIWQEAAPGSALTNLYGPTEATIFCTSYTVPRDGVSAGSPGGAVVPLGAPLPGIECAVLDEHGRSAVIGELCLRGPQRFAGYLDPADDRSRFHRADGGADGSVSAEDWYRTGDRVEVRGEVLHFVGRLDHQVKVNGFRIELGEVESALRSLDDVEDALAVAVADATGTLALFAVCVPATLLPGDVRTRLLARLPAQLVPRRIVPIPALPRNGNGKSDRRAVAGIVEAAIGLAPPALATTGGRQ